MADFLFATWDGGGVVPVVLGVGRELTARGHRVRVMSHGAQRQDATDAGLAFVPYAHARDWNPRAEQSTLAGGYRMVRLATDSGMAADVLDAVRTHQPDVVVVDCMLPGVSKRLHEAGVDHATLFNTMYGYFDGLYRFGPIGIGSRMLGVGDPRDVWKRSKVQLIFSDRDLDPTRRVPTGEAEWVGPVHDASAPATPPESPRVLVSLSTVGYPGLAGNLQRILDACAGVAAEFVVTTGPAVDPDSLRTPANATVHRYVPHNEILPTCTAVINHGGHATAMRALAHGLLMLCVPMHPLTDQPLVSRAVADAGAGLVIGRAARVDNIRQAIRTLLETDSYRAAAASIGRRLRANNGTVRGADRLEALIDVPLPQV